MNIVNRLPDLNGLSLMLRNIPYMTANCLLGRAKLAPNIFDRLSQAIRRMLSRRSFTIVSYIDDLFLFELTQDMCLNTINTLLNAVSSLGFLVSWSKVEGPSERITFSGIAIDSTCMELRLPNTKLCNSNAS